MKIFTGPCFSFITCYSENHPKPLKMEKLPYLIVLLLLLRPGLGHGSDSTGQIRRHTAFPSEYVAARDIAVWLPEGYREDGGKRYSVIYAHDGQNLFNPASSYSGEDWGLDETLPSLIENKKVSESIIVAIWNTPARLREYQLAAPYDNLCSDLKKYVFTELGGKPSGEEYLKFIVEELKPFIDRNYATLPDKENTVIMGSSMGGLISLYAITRYPGVFGGAVCISTHWPSTMNFNNPVLGNMVVSYLAGKLPDPRSHKIYFDYGTESIDAMYEPYQLRMDSVMRASGYEEDKNWITRKFEGHEHSEKDWKRRVHFPLEFLLGYHKE